MAVHAYASGNWHVRGGSEDEFVSTWTAFLEWSREAAPGLVGASLIREEGGSGRFVSVAEWADGAARAGWQSHAGFAERLGACRSLCDDFVGGSFELVAHVT